MHKLTKQVILGSEIPFLNKGLESFIKVTLFSEINIQAPVVLKRTSQSLIKVSLFSEFQEEQAPVVLKGNIAEPC